MLAQLSPTVLVALAMVLWVIVEAIGAMPIRRIGVPELVWLRYVIHVGLMLALFAPTRGLAILRTRQLPLQVVRSLMMAVMPLSFMFASQRLPTARLLTWFWITPLAILALARWQHESIQPRIAALALLAWCGVLIVYPPALQADPGGIAFSILMALSFAAYIVMTPVLDRTDGVLTNLFYSAAGVLVVLTPAVPFVWRAPSTNVWLAVIAVAVLGWVTLWLLDLALRRATPGQIAVIMFVQVPFTIAFAAAARGRLGQPRAWIGSAIVLVAVALAMRISAARGSSEPLLNPAPPVGSQTNRQRT